MGLLSIGAAEASADAHATEMLAYAHDTNHEKIIRGLAVGLALLCYGREEGADSMIEQLSTDQVLSLAAGSIRVQALVFISLPTRQFRQTQMSLSDCRAHSWTCSC